MIRNNLHILFFILFISLNTKTVSASTIHIDTLALFTDESTIENIKVIYDERPAPFFHFLNKKPKTKSYTKLVAAALAFPFPFGIVGLHRIYLGTAPYVPVAYIGTLGGVFGILPLIDFFTIIFSKNFENYKKNPQVFMWIKKT